MADPSHVACVLSGLLVSLVVAALFVSALLSLAAALLLFLREVFIATASSFATSPNKDSAQRKVSAAGIPRLSGRFRDALHTMAFA